MRDQGEKHRRTSAAQSLDGPWLSDAAQAGLPSLRRDFDMNRDPFTRAQLQSRGGGDDPSGRSQHPGAQEKPEPHLKPKGPLRRAADRAAAIDGWLAAQRDTAMAQSSPHQKAFSRDVLAPSRSVRARHR